LFILSFENFKEFLEQNSVRFLFHVIHFHAPASAASTQGYSGTFAYDSILTVSVSTTILMTALSVFSKLEFPGRENGNAAPVSI